MANSRCVFLTMESLENFVVDDNAAVPPLKARGWEVSHISWRDNDVDWGAYEMVIIRTTWDYQQAPRQFIDRLRQIDQQSILQNSLSLVEWNMDKRYLRDLQQRGIVIVPTIWVDAGTAIDFDHYSQLLGSDTLIVKPVISANADFTYRFDRQNFDDLREDFRSAFLTRDFMIQSFMPAIVTEGEFSLFFFCGKYSHAILKLPGRGDFRVQEEHGGMIQAIEPSRQLRRTADEVLAVIPETALYARIDFVRESGEQYCLMELELIEPSLYFRFDPAAARRFAEAVDSFGK